MRSQKGFRGDRTSESFMRKALSVLRFPNNSRDSGRTWTYTKSGLAILFISNNPSLRAKLDRSCEVRILPEAIARLLSDCFASLAMTIKGVVKPDLVLHKICNAAILAVKKPPLMAALRTQGRCAWAIGWCRCAFNRRIFFFPLPIPSL